MTEETTKKNRVRVAIIDDHPAVREGLAIRIDATPDLEVCGEASDEPEAVALIEKVRPDVAVVDIALKTGNGIDLIKQVKSRSNLVAMLVWSMYDESLYAQRALRAGALGYINKENATGEIVEAIRCVSQGKVYLSESMSQQVLSGFAKGREQVGKAPSDLLSDRELETFGLIGKGLTTQEIAKRMFLSPKTVETYRARIKQKLDLHDMAELTREAVQWVLEKG